MTEKTIAQQNSECKSLHDRRSNSQRSKPHANRAKIREEPGTPDALRPLREAAQLVIREKVSAYHAKTGGSAEPFRLSRSIGWIDGNFLHITPTQMDQQNFSTYFQRLTETS